MAFNELNEFMGLNWLNQFQFSKDSQRSMDSDIFDAMFLPFSYHLATCPTCPSIVATPSSVHVVPPRHGHPRAQSAPSRRAFMNSSMFFLKHVFSYFKVTFIYFIYSYLQLYHLYQTTVDPPISFASTTKHRRRKTQRRLCVVHKSTASGPETWTYGATATEKMVLLLFPKLCSLMFFLNGTQVYLVEWEHIYIYICLFIDISVFNGNIGSLMGIYHFWGETLARINLP